MRIGRYRPQTSNFQIIQRRRRVQPSEAKPIVPDSSARSSINSPINARFPPSINHKSNSSFHAMQTIPSTNYLLIGMPSFAGGGEMFSATLSMPSRFLTPSTSSTLVCRFRNELSLTGLPLATPPPLPSCTLPLPAPPTTPAAPTPGELRCGIFSGSGCWEPTLPVSTEDAFPALDSA